MTVMLSATTSLDWYRERLAGRMSFGRREDLENSRPVCSNGGRMPWRDSDTRSWVKLTESYRPDPWRGQEYTQWYEEYRQLYWSVKDQYKHIATLLERGK
jgi:hypothetical protein